MITEADCTSCGACCVEAGPVPVFPRDHVPDTITTEARSMIGARPYTPLSDERWMDSHMGGHCKQLHGTVGCSVMCRIWRDRPSTCRNFRPGSEACLYVREIMQHKLRKNVPDNSGWTPRYRGYGEDWETTV